MFKDYIGNRSGNIRFKFRRQSDGGGLLPTFRKRAISWVSSFLALSWLPSTTLYFHSLSLKSIMCFIETCYISLKCWGDEKGANSHGIKFPIMSLIFLLLLVRSGSHLFWDAAVTTVFFFFSSSLFAASSSFTCRSLLSLLPTLISSVSLVLFSFF